MLLTTSLMGTLSLCSFNRALRVGGVRFFWIKYLICFLSIILSQYCSALLIALWFLVVGSLGMVWKLLSEMNGCSHVYI
jgi:hypothetical protein